MDLENLSKEDIKRIQSNGISDQERKELQEQSERIRKEKTEALEKDFVGLPKQEAIEKAMEKGFTEIRITREDDNHYRVTYDMVFKRINFAIDSGKITEVYIG